MGLNPMCLGYTHHILTLHTQSRRERKEGKKRRRKEEREGRRN